VANNIRPVRNLIRFKKDVILFTYLETSFCTLLKSKKAAVYIYALCTNQIRFAIKDCNLNFQVGLLNVLFIPQNK